MRQNNALLVFFETCASNCKRCTKVRKTYEKCQITTEVVVGSGQAAHAVHPKPSLRVPLEHGKQTLWFLGAKVT